MGAAAPTVAAPTVAAPTVAAPTAAARAARAENKQAAATQITGPRDTSNSTFIYWRFFLLLPAIPLVLLAFTMASALLEEGSSGISTGNGPHASTKATRRATFNRM